MEANMGDRFVRSSGPRFGGLLAQIRCSYADLVQVFGEPQTPEDPYKVSTVWNLKDTALECHLDIYEYKETSHYYKHLPTVEAFRALPVYDWHVSGGDRVEVMALARFIAKKLGRKVKDVPKTFPWDTTTFDVTEPTDA